MEGGWDDDVRARLSELLRREPVPPAELLEHCCAILDEALRSQSPSAGPESDAAAVPLAFRRLGEKAAMPAVADEAEMEYGASLPLRSLQPGYAKQYDARSQVFVDQYIEAASLTAARPPIVDMRKAKIDAFAKLTEEARPPPQSQAALTGTYIGGGYSRSQPLHQKRFKRITVRPANAAAWGMLKYLVPELQAASEVTIVNFPAPLVGAKDAVDPSRRIKGDAPPVVPNFAEPQKVELQFSTASSAKPFHRRITLEPNVANLIKDMDGEVVYDWHKDSFTRTAVGVYAGENGDPRVNQIEARLRKQQLEKAARLGEREWRN